MTIEPLEDEAGDILRKARRGQHMAVPDVARRAGLAVERLEALERLASPPSEAESLSLASVLGLDRAKLARIAAGGYHPRSVGDRIGSMHVRRLVVRQPDGWTSNCYLVGFHGGEEAIVVDPGAEPERILAELDRLRWRPRYIALTHGHYDHVGGLGPIHDEWAVSVLMGRGDLDMLSPLPERLHVVTDGEQLSINGVKLEARLTPGHTAGGVSFRLDSCCFVGDALFAGSLGNANVPVDGYRQLRSSVWRQVLQLDPGDVLFPGHGPATTVGEERAANPFFPESFAP